MLGLLQPLTVQKRDGKYALLAGGQAHHPRYAALPGWRERACVIEILPPRHLHFHKSPQPLALL
ncbi:MAG: hypothetical protein COB65_02135 [Thalassobium sp.]|nr:MAG: hypothetical protein COB65_02135 [Thalassobium sp.]